MAKVEFHFDFGSPNAYLAHLVVPEIEQRTGVEIRIRADAARRRFQADQQPLAGGEAGGHQEPPGVRAARNCSASSAATASRTSRANPFFPVNTLLIMRGAVAAQLDGVFERYVDEMFRHMWAEPKKMDDPEVLRAALSTSRASTPTGLLARTQEPEVKERLLKNTEARSSAAPSASPTFFVGDEIFFGKDRLRDVEEEIVRANG